jgi:hypothetical protein
MKHLIIITTSLLLWSCVVVKHGNSEYIVLYKQRGFGEVLPEYLVLKDRIKSYEFFSPGLGSNVLGDYNIINDTIYLNPKYEYSESIKSLSLADTSIISIPRKLLIKKNLLIDMTDYKKYPVLSLFFKKGEIIYKRLK